ncbi:hypothetical protein, variant [Allomyces macrogynus ATCC 38327]|uniref:CDP-alcohol phosphatidyltransferase n=1 Tax=Allomyces macrogynus (strain ATCC 38327) TaxID=578462 RepID=A0A0L0T0E0_ALLM3|nr:hypothetical protein, variant [Allomyces macrogynus ATCC 38327]|eukprot:KNE68236.1 hypothetical protein, variant [Allomyces macrogynus ATCC 38327]
MPSRRRRRTPSRARSTSRPAAAARPASASAPAEPMPSRATPARTTRIIPAHLVSNLRLYKYAGADKSLVSRYILQPYWTALVEWVPMWMAPNLVTLIGFAFIVANVLMTLWWSPDLVTPLPRWCYFVFGLGLFIYQSLDAIDGKQARRTGQSGPLGELFDHGCDALNTTMSVLMVAPALGYGQSPWLLVSLGCTLANFYLTTWEEYHTGVLYLGLISGPVEGILMIVAVLVSTGIFGPSMWHQPLLGLPLTSFDLTMAAGILVIFINLATSIQNVVRATRSLQPITGLAPFLVACATVASWAFASPWLLKEGGNVPLMLWITAWFGHLVGTIILAHVVKDERFPYLASWGNLRMAVLGAAVAVGGYLVGYGFGCSSCFVEDADADLVRCGALRWSRAPSKSGTSTSARPWRGSPTRGLRRA